jgi:monovalent cation:H+ antiporter, CPA1 family
LVSEFPIFALGLALLTASLVAMISRRLRLPYSVGLVVAGIVVPAGMRFIVGRDWIGAAL